MVREKRIARFYGRDSQNLFAGTADGH